MELLKSFERMPLADLCSIVFDERLRDGIDFDIPLVRGELKKVEQQLAVLDPGDRR